MERDENYPRPQFVRDEWYDLTGPWGFAFDDTNAGVAQGWTARADPFDRTIVVPFPPESPASGINEKASHPVVWYRRGFRVPPASSSPPQRWLLHFGAVDYRAQVWVNEQLVAQHEGGHTPFTADITAALRADLDEQVVVVRAEDEMTDLAQPRGKQHWELEPAGIWFPRTTGIWQPVWLEPVPATYMTGIRWTPDPERGLLGLEMRLNHAPGRPVRVRVRLSLRGARLADDSYVLDGSTLHREIALNVPAIGEARNHLLWSPEHPNLIDAELALEDVEPSGAVIDRVLSYAGLRSVDVRNGRFRLNGRPYYLRLALEQGYWPESHLAAPSPAALRRDVELAKALGFNGLRVHQKVEDPRFLYWCDRLGLLVWGEMANAYAFSVTAMERLLREWVDVLGRDYSHPCIVTWVPLNESWGVPDLEQDPVQRHYVRALYHLTRALDPTRPAIGNDGWEHFAGDIVGIHDYALDGQTIRERYGSAPAVERSMRETQPYYHPIVLPGEPLPSEPVMLTECGGIEYVPGAGNPDGLPRHAGDADEFVTRYSELIDAILACPTVHGFCYTELTDVVQEKCGLLTEDRVPKIAPEIIRAITTRPAAAVPAEATLGPDQVAAEAQATSDEAGFDRRAARAVPIANVDGAGR